MESKTTIRIACAQIECNVAAPDTNLDKHLDWIERARKKHCDILVFPELSLTGYGTRHSVIEVSRRADCNELQRLAESSEGMYSVVGFIEQGRGGLLYNSTAWLSDGQVVLVQRKLNIPTYGRLDEGRYYCKGSTIETLKLDHNWIAATLICADFWNPGLVYAAAQKKTTLIITPIASTSEAVGDGFENPDGWDLNTRFYGMTYATPIALCNWTGRSDNQIYWGGSRIIDETGAILVQASNKEEFIYADLDYQKILKARFRLPTLRDSDLDLVLRELNSIRTEKKFN